MSTFAMNQNRAFACVIGGRQIVAPRRLYSASHGRAVDAIYATLRYHQLKTSSSNSTAGYYRHIGTCSKQGRGVPYARTHVLARRFTEDKYFIISTISCLKCAWLSAPPTHSCLLRCLRQLHDSHSTTNALQNNSVLPVHMNIPIAGRLSGVWRAATM